MNRCYDVDVLESEYEKYSIPVDIAADLATEECLWPISNASLANVRPRPYPHTQTPPRPSDPPASPQGVFMCDELPECEIQCDGLSDEDGNDQSTLKPTIHRACCTCEWWCAQQHGITSHQPPHRQRWP